MTGDIIGLTFLAAALILACHADGLHSWWRHATRDRITPLLNDHERSERLLPEICGCSVRFSNEADRGEFTWCAAHCPDCRRERHGFLVPCAQHDAGWAEEMERRYAQS